MNNILAQPFTIEKCEKFNQYCKENNKRIEQIGDKRYALDYNEIVVDGQIVINENYEAEQQQIERERIAHLSLTRGDVFRGLLLARGVTRLMLRGMIETNEQFTEVQKEMALIDFDEALNFYRGNALIDTVGLALGIEAEQLDKFFEANDYTVLLPQVEEVVNENN